MAESAADFAAANLIPFVDTRFLHIVHFIMANNAHFNARMLIPSLFLNILANKFSFDSHYSASIFCYVGSKF